MYTTKVRSFSHLDLIAWLAAVQLLCEILVKGGDRERERERERERREKRKGKTSPGWRLPPTNVSLCLTWAPCSPVWVGQATRNLWQVCMRPVCPRTRCVVIVVVSPHYVEDSRSPSPRGSSGTWADSALSCSFSCLLFLFRGGRMRGGVTFSGPFTCSSTEKSVCSFRLCPSTPPLILSLFGSDSLACLRKCILV